VPEPEPRAADNRVMDDALTQSASKIEGRPLLALVNAQSSPVALMAGELIAKRALNLGNLPLAASWRPHKIPTSPGSRLQRPQETTDKTALSGTLRHDC
jgi:hypothetical protein